MTHTTESAAYPHDLDISREWVCAAGLPGYGPLFYARDWDLQRAMDYAEALCERRMHDDCFPQGCTLEPRGYR